MRQEKKILDPITGLKSIMFLIIAIIALRLGYLQIIRYDYYQTIANKEHIGETELPARRGEIFIKDYASGEDIRVATNVTLDTLFVDPTIIKNKKLVADRLAPLIYDIDEARALDYTRIEEEKKRAKTPEELEKIKPLNDEELYKYFYDNLLAKISAEQRAMIILANDLPKETLAEINLLSIPGIEVTEKELRAYPEKITNKSYVAAALDKYLNISPQRLEQILVGKNRYVIIKKKIKPEISNAIQKIIDTDKDKNFFGIGLKEEYYRYYPESTLASNVLGFVTPDGMGAYGIETKYNSQLQGKKGLFKAQKDGSVYGRQITVGDAIIQPAVDGDNIYLTIDRSMQMQVEKMLEKAVKDYRADSGQVIIMDPKTGGIMTMAHYPDFDPNNYGKVTDEEEISLSPEEIEQLVPIDNESGNFWFYRNEIAHDRYKVMLHILNTGQKIYTRFKNWIGVEAYQNKAVSQPYEPGSIMKPLIMASALDDKDVTPTTSFNDPGFLNVDMNVNTGKYDSEPITNVSSACTGHITMTEVIANSCNTGIAWVAKKMGKSLFYSYLIKYGFGERTGVEFDNEHPGKLTHFSTWTAESDFLTKAFGQGITATPLQMTAAFSALANKGVMMQPHIVEKIEQRNGKTVVTEPAIIQRIIGEDAANTITAILVNAVENGVAKKAALPNHYLGAKTGTAQTYKNGKALTGAGTTITSIVGYAPIDNPRFVVLVKLDRPRSSEWADSTAALLFKDIMAYLFDHFGIPPDKNIN